MFAVRRFRHTHATPRLLALATGGALLLAACAPGDSPTASPPLRETEAGAAAETASQSGAPPPTPGAGPVWGSDGAGWINLGGPPPDCPETLPPVIDVSLATSTLYPGQVRGDYKAHGGFRFDGLPPDAVEVRSPIDGVALRGARYLASGELQYTIDLVHPCGLMVRLGHLRELTPEWMEHFESYPPPIELDSRSSQFNPPIPVRAGELIAISVGIYGTNNTFVDIGMYNLRERNATARDPAWLAEHDNDTAPYGICWFSLHGPEEEAAILALPPADGVMGRTSDYCTSE